VSDDWVVKGCHIHVDGVELRIFTNHLGSFDIGGFFGQKRKTQYELRRENAAIKKAWKECVPDPAMRKRWIQRLEMARVHVINYQGKLSRKAQGRMFDFKLVRIAIERWGKQHGNP
jgi:hypothetical protein